MTHTKDEASVKELQRYSPDGEGGMELDSLGAYVKLQDVTTPPAAQPAPVQEPVAWVTAEDVKVFNTVQGESVFLFQKNGKWNVPLYTTPPAAPVLEGRDWSLLEATQESLREHMAEIKRLKEAQPAPVREPVREPVATLFGSLPVYDTTPPAAQRQWVGLTDYEIGVCSTEAAMNRSAMVGGAVTFARAIEAKLKEKNSD